MRRQKDIEIFIRGCSEDRLLAWIGSAVGCLTNPEDGDEATVYSSPAGPVIVTPSECAFTSVWFNSSHTPWATDVECARQAARELGCVVWCDPGEHFPDVHPASDIFLEIEGGIERLVEWEDCREGLPPTGAAGG